jgi:hypothetical protein
MQLQAALCQASLKFGLEGLGFSLVPGVNQSIISKPTPRKVLVRQRHTEIECAMNEEVRQNRLTTPPGGLPLFRSAFVPSSRSMGAVIDRS